MSTAVLLLFFALLVALLGFTIKRPALALPIGILTYAYKQVAALAVPFLQSYDSLFNYLIAIPILATFLRHNFPKVRAGFETREGKLVMTLVWVYLGLFWMSSFWSPYFGLDSWKFLPYFAIYFWMLPLLIDADPEVTIKAFLVAWSLTFVGALGLLLSPAFHVTPNTERMVVHFQAGRFEDANPLVIADMGAYLVMMSLLLFTQNRSATGSHKLLEVARSTAGIAGVALGIWLAFNTSRGETFSCLACGCLFVALVNGKSLLQSMLWLGGLVFSLVVVVSLSFVLFLPKANIEKLSNRYTQDAIMEGSGQRKDLNSENIRFVLSSPTDFLFGLGARASEKRIGAWPHNQFVQAFSETGVLGLVLLSTCFFLALRFGLRTLTMARLSAHYPSLVFTAFVLSLFAYQILVLSKKGSLTFVDTYMWLAIAAYSFDRTQGFLSSRMIGRFESSS